jgi:hypothetical protein
MFPIITQNILYYTNSTNFIKEEISFIVSMPLLLRLMEYNMKRGNLYEQEF